MWEVWTVENYDDAFAFRRYKWLNRNSLFWYQCWILAILFDVQLQRNLLIRVIIDVGDVWSQRSEKKWKIRRSYSLGRWTYESYRLSSISVQENIDSSNILFQDLPNSRIQTYWKVQKNISSNFLFITKFFDNPIL